MMVCVFFNSCSGVVVVSTRYIGEFGSFLGLQCVSLFTSPPGQDASFFEVGMQVVSHRAEFCDSDHSVGRDGLDPAPLGKHHKIPIILLAP